MRTTIPTEQLTIDDTDTGIRLKTAWQRVLGRLSNEVSPAWFERFLKVLNPISLDQNDLLIEAPGQFVMEWVRGRFLVRLEHMFGEELGQNVSVQLKAVPRKKNESSAPQVSVNSSPVQNHTHSSFTPSPFYTFEKFIVGQSNRMAFAGAKRLADDPQTQYSPLFIYGRSGLGKTHLMHAVAHEALKADPKLQIAYITAQSFAEEFISSIQTGRMEQFRRSQRNVGMWLVDDIQLIAGKDKTCEEVFHTFNNLQALGRRIVLCSDRPPRELYGMDDRLRSRFESGLVADIQLPDTETRCAILLSKAEIQGIGLEHETAMYLAENVPSGNIRVLEGALKTLCVEASLCHQTPNVQLAADIVERYFKSSSLAKPSVKQIVDAVSKHYKITPIDIQGASRKAPVVHARHIAIYITREITHDSWKHIGSQFGDRDHTSIMHGHQKISEMIGQDRDLQNAVTMLIRNLYPDS